MTQNSQKPGMLTISQAATLLMVTPTWIRQLVRLGYIPKPEKDLVPLVGAVQGYVKHLKDDERRHSKTSEARRVQAARAHEIELRTAREEGRLIYLESAEQVFAEVLGVYRSRLAGLSAAATRDLTIRQKIEDQLERVIDEARADFARKRTELLADARKGKK